jgi:hypothetical protein
MELNVSKMSLCQGAWVDAAPVVYGVNSEIVSQYQRNTILPGVLAMTGARKIKASARSTPKAKNRSLGDARAAKTDEFYTQIPDIERELRHYRQHFEGKVVYLNCDDPRVSNFFHYFSYNFEALGLKKLIATCYKSQAVDLFSQNDSEEAIWIEQAIESSQ